MPKLSIIVTAYNIEKYIRQSLDCIINQTLKDIEIIIVDDGSSDNTPSIIDEYAQNDARVRAILFEKNTIGGVASAANAGLEVARGDYIGFADGDDIYSEDMFEKLYDAAVLYSADLAMCRYNLFDDKTGETALPSDEKHWNAYPEITNIEMREQTRRDLFRFVAVPWRKIYKRDLIERINLRFPVGEYFFEDNPFHWAAILGGENIVMVPEVLCQHRVARVGQTMSTVDSKLLRIFQHHDNILLWLKKFNAMEQYRMDLFRWMAGQLSWVSERAEDSVMRELFDTLIPIVAQYDGVFIEHFGESYGRGRTYKMLKAIHTKNYDQFERAANINKQDNKNTQSTPKKLSKHKSAAFLIKRGLYHLRYSGIRSTSRMVGRYTKLNSPLASRFSRRKTPASQSNNIANEDLMVALIILQNDVRNLRSDINALQLSDKIEQNVDST